MGSLKASLRARRGWSTRQYATYLSASQAVREGERRGLPAPLPAFKPGQEVQVIGRDGAMTTGRVFQVPQVAGDPYRVTPAPLQIVRVTEAELRAWNAPAPPPPPPVPVMEATPEPPAGDNWFSWVKPGCSNWLTPSE